MTAVLRKISFKRIMHLTASLILSFISSLLIGYVLASGVLTPWKPLPLPNNEQLKSLHWKTGTDNLATGIFAVSKENNLYLYLTDYDQAVEEWQPVTGEEVAGKNFIRGSGNDRWECQKESPEFKYYWVPNISGNIVDQLYCQTEWAELRIIYNLVLLDNGKVWLWRHKGGIHAVGIHITTTWVFLLGGFIISLIAFFKRKLPRVRE